jgi:transposase
VKFFACQKRLRQLEKQNHSLQQEVQQLTEENLRLKKENQRLQSQLAKSKKTSANSSKPPSSDIVKKKGRKRGKNPKRKIGGQPGHPKHERPLFLPDLVDYFHNHDLKCCPDCQGPVHLDPQSQPRILQQVELPQKLFEVHQHTAHGYWCAPCGKTHYAPMPPHLVKGGLLGPRMTSMVALLKGPLSFSYTKIQTYLREVFQLRVSRGILAKAALDKSGPSLAIPYRHLLVALPQQFLLNVDETGHKDNGRPWWTWVFRGDQFALFKIEESRGSQVLMDVLGREFEGVLGCDYFSAYRKYMSDCDVRVQFCLAHLIREVRFLSEHSRWALQQYGQGLLKKLRQLFKLIHERDSLDAAAFEQALQKTKRQIIRWATQTQFISPFEWYRREDPDYRLVENLADRFRKHGEAFFQFITTPGLEPTNNLAEQAIRFIVIGRRVTQGTRGQKGRDFCERTWTVWATCQIQGRSTFQFLLDSYLAWLHKSRPPDLIPVSPG